MFRPRFKISELSIWPSWSRRQGSACLVPLVQISPLSGFHLRGVFAVPVKSRGLHCEMFFARRVDSFWERSVRPGGGVDVVQLVKLSGSVISWRLMFRVELLGFPRGRVGCPGAGAVGGVGPGAYWQSCSVAVK